MLVNRSQTWQQYERDWEMFQSCTYPRCEVVCGAGSQVCSHLGHTAIPDLLVDSIRGSRIQGGDSQLGTKPPTPPSDLVVSFPLAKL